MDINSLPEIKDGSCSDANFTVNLLRKYFTDEELKGRNVSGFKGKQALDRIRIHKVQQYFFKCTLVQREKLKKRNGQRLQMLSALIQGDILLTEKKEKSPESRL